MAYFVSRSLRAVGMMENAKHFVNCVQQCAQKLPRGSARGWKVPNFLNWLFQAGMCDVVVIAQFAERLSAALLLSEGRNVEERPEIA
jgi:hypothetical protein